MKSKQLINYPVNLIPDENGTVIACFPDVPEAMTVGADEANALEWAQDALVVALSGLYGRSAGDSRTVFS
ncbi:MAG: type II toxin-antitoxin system HicB family antitoxin [Desulfobacteraceae bacterium]|nr:type II toxin-antitoxin system HicB family antitoxin [Desulfobacteraceae bacterium]